MKSKISIILLGLILIGSITYAALPSRMQLQFQQQLNSFLDDLLKNLKGYNEHLPEDRVYAHFDKTLYKPGETIWFSAFIRDGQSLKKSNQSDIVNVELYNPKGAIEKEYKIIAKNGVAKGDFQLDPAAVGGIYKVKVYTNWMTNDQLPAVFTKELTVQKVILPRLKMKLDFIKKAYGAGDKVAAELTINDNTNKALKNHDFNYIVNLAGKKLAKGKGTTGNEGEAMVQFDLPKKLKTNDGLLNIMIKYQGQTESISRSVPIVLNKIIMGLYPEGGDLVVGLKSKVAFNAFNEFDKAADIEGVVVNSKGNAITSFASYHQGMGSFEITPQEDEEYTVKITKPAGVENTYKLPEAMPMGYVLEVRDVDADQVYLTIKSSHEEELYLIGNVRGKKYFSTKVNAKKGEIKTTIPTKYFPIGVAHFTLFDSKGIERAERLAFVNKDKQLNISIKTDKDKYQPREKVRMTIKVSDERGMPMPANLSVAVVDDQLLSFADDKSSNILSWMLMEADIKRKVEEPNFYFDKKEEKAHLALDYLLMTSGWRRFIWKQIREGTKPTIRQYGEKAIIAGKITDPQTGKPMAKVEVKLENGKYKTVTDKEGKYAFIGYEMGSTAPLMTFDKKGYNQQRLYVSQYSNQYNTYLYETYQRRRARLLKRQKSMRESATKGNRPNPVLPAPAIEEVLDEEVEEDIVFERQEFDEDEIVDVAPIQAVEPVEAPRIEEEKEAIEEIFEPQKKKPAVEKDLVDKNLKSDDDVMVKEVMEEKVMADQKVKDRRSAAPKKKREFAKQGKRFDRPARKPVPKRAGQYHRARQFAAPIYDKNEPIAKRTDFRSTVYWNGNVEIDRKGKTVLEFYNSDAVTSFRVTAEGFAADGMVGRQEHLFFTQMPFSLSAKLPVEVVTQDVLKVPLTLVNNTKRTIKGDLKITFPKGLSPKGKLPKTATLAAGKAKTQYLTFNVNERGNADKIAIAFKSSGFNDEIEKSLTVISKGFPTSLAMSGEALDKIYNFKVSDLVSGSMDVNVTAYPSSLSDMLSGLESMLRQPSGCFEQTSSSTYPNILVLNYLQETNQANPKISSKAKKFIDAGYKRLAGYESKSGGFEWFGGDPGHEGLTAYGLMEFVDMQKVYDGVDQAMIDRTTEWLMKRRDGMGKFKRNPRALHSFGLTDNETMSIYITWALTEANFTDLQTEVDFAYAEAKKTKSPYQLGLAANILFNRGQEKRGQELLTILMDIQADEGAWKHGSSHKSAPGSSGKALRIETAALAALATMKSKTPNRMKLKKCMDFIKSSRGSFGGYSSTNSTVLALRALVAYAKFSKRADESGSIEVYVNGDKVKTFDYEKGHDKPIVIEGLANYVKEGSNKVQVKYANTKTALPYTVAVNYSTVLPYSQKECVINLKTKIAKTKIKVGETVRLTATLSNKTTEGQPMTMAIVGLPAGLTAQPWQLKELLEKKNFDFYEVIGNNLVFYYRQMKPSERRVINLDLKADIAGTFDAPASSAYLYYTDEHKHWTALKRVQIVAN